MMFLNRCPNFALSRGITVESIFFFLGGLVSCFVVYLNTYILGKLHKLILLNEKNDIEKAKILRENYFSQIRQIIIYLLTRWLDPCHSGKYPSNRHHAPLNALCQYVPR